MATITAPRLLVDGLLTADPTLETYRVTPGRATAVKLAGDDHIRIIDRHGGQVAELTALAAEGADDLGALGLRADASASVVNGLTGREKGAVRLFGPDSAPGSDASLTAERDTTLVVAAPGGRIVDGEQPATELLLEVRRAT